MTRSFDDNLLEPNEIMMSCLDFAQDCDSGEVGATVHKWYQSRRLCEVQEINQYNYPPLPNS